MYTCQYTSTQKEKNDSVHVHIFIGVYRRGSVVNVVKLQTPGNAYLLWKLKMN